MSSVSSENSRDSLSSSIKSGGDSLPSFRILYAITSPSYTTVLLFRIEENKTYIHTHRLYTQYNCICQSCTEEYIKGHLDRGDEERREMCGAESWDGMAARGGVKKMQSTMNRVADAYFSLSLYWDHQPVLCFLDTIKRRKSQRADIKFFLFLIRLTASQPSVIYSLYWLYLFIYLFISSSSIYTNPVGPFSFFPTRLPPSRYFPQFPLILVIYYGNWTRDFCYYIVVVGLFPTERSQLDDEGRRNSVDISRI